MKKLCLPVLAAFVLCGCGKGGDSVLRDRASPTPPPPASSSAAATKSSATPIPGKVDPYLTTLLQQFVKEKGRLPASFLEFTGAKAESVPRPPEGYAYEIDAATTEVKLVKR